MPRVEDKLKRIYYGPQGYWRGASAIKKLAAATRVSEETAKDWLKKQTIWQVYLPAPRYIPRPSFTVNAPNEVHIRRTCSSCRTTRLEERPTDTL